MAFGQAHAFLIGDKRAVIEIRLFQPERAVEQELPEGGAQQVRAAYDFGDANGGVIDDTGELVTGNIVFTPDKEVAEVAAGDSSLWA